MAGETQREGKRKRKKKRKREHPPPPASPRYPDEAFFPLVIASCANIRKPYARQILEQLLLAQLVFVRARGGAADSRSLDQILHPGLLSLLPLLLNQTCKDCFAVLAAEIVGAIALCSLYANEGIASDGETVKAVVAALGNPSKKVAMAACNAVLDLAAGPLGRERLRESFAVEKLSVFCQVVAVPAPSLHSCSTYKGKENSFIMGCMEDIFLTSLLDAARVLINTCNNEFLDKIAGEVSRTFLLVLQEICLRYCNHKGNMSSTKHDLAETIFRLSMNQISYTTCMPDLVKRSMFGNEWYDFENFILNYWEKAPILLKNASNNGIILFNCLDFSSRTINAAMDSILQNLVSCPPITSDELDILNFLEEVNGVLGSPIVYGQDIRVVKTQKLLSGSGNGNVKEEVHYFNNFTGSNNDVGSVFSCSPIQKCKEAVQSGYTIALRGLEFRSKKIAALSDGLAALFGQPSVGANVYLTPADSQGLSRHYDDHCVFVCQLLGTKRWIVFPQSADSAPLLPRLYESRHSSSCLELAGNFSEGKEFFLHEGDILYIPRGCPHEAYTTTSGTESQINQSTFSLHLTLAIEVEPPFEWEGFAHVALCCWDQKQKEKYPFVDRRPEIPNFMIINLLHIAITLIGDHVPAFRKACLVAASLQSDNGSAVCAEHLQNLALLQKSIFGNIIDSIDVESNFMDAFRKMEEAVHEKNNSFLPRLRWIQHLFQEGNEIMFDFNNMLEAFEEFLLFARGCMEAVETIFVQVKHQFCTSIIFEDVRKSFETLQNRYKKTRRQYMNGMLALHSAS
ncbi:hypothetical protein Taro_007787 [Colocasia esculenta]|uniref:Bifunctional lysine-specific demethylase and histidyl-hydroxylase n=1 Tax=Colocasia esculenta TaxID=4460 RepID=A0A843TVU9_COLES|nr:hypothetical protein [Colocasia esculenta]